MRYTLAWYIAVVFLLHFGLMIFYNSIVEKVESYIVEYAVQLPDFSRDSLSYSATLVEYDIVDV